MKVIHIESGLGNQMLSYCELLAIQKMNPQEVCFIETMVYDIPECNDTICQWNGYELDRIFGIRTKNIRELFSNDDWKSIMEEVRASEFWSKNWNWPVYISCALNKHGLQLNNLLGDYEKEENHDDASKRGLIGKLRGKLTNGTRLGNYLRRLITSKGPASSVQQGWHDRVFIKSEKNILAGQQLVLKYCGAGIDTIEEDVRNTFVFPDFVSQKNREFATFLCNCNSVFIHARRGDMLSANGWCYKYGYFRRAVKYIKKKVENPVFVFFTNTGSIQWCKENARIFGLDYNKDKVFFVDWNTGEESYRDMQLMALCKHGIITNSSFGWWGAYFIKNPNKITISPLTEIYTTYHC